MTSLTLGSDSGPPPVPRDSLGCPFSKLDTDLHLSAEGISFHRKSSLSPRFGQVATPASDRGFLIGVSTKGGHRRRIFHEHRATEHDFPEDGIYIRNFCDDYRADLQGNFDFVLMEFSTDAFGHFADDAGNGPARTIACTPGERDPVVANLLRALGPAFAQPNQARNLFVEQVSAAIGTHLLQTYGQGRRPATDRTRSLSRANERLAKEILRAGIRDDVSVAEIAAACNLSRGHFIRAFRETTGQTPYQWLQSQRVEIARDLLVNTPLSLADIALACGFADQSHFTRVFAHIVGTPPGQWRRGLR